MIIVNGHCKLRNGGHCGTCRTDADWRGRTGTPDECPEGFTSENFPDVPIETTGPGTELKRLLTKVGITEQEGCGCGALSAKMNRWGVDGCEARMPEIVHQLTMQAALRDWLRFVPFKEIGATGLVTLAIMNARNQNQKAVEKTAP